jgi:hypothetical protein
VLLTQAKVDNANVMELLEQLKGYDKVKLTSLIVAILNANRSNISKLGYKAIEAENTDNLVSRNIMV